MKRIYFPMTLNVLTPGHIKCLKQLIKKGEVIIGLLTAAALKGYKEEYMPYEDREYIVRELIVAIGGNITVVQQRDLNPLRNLQKYKCTAIASGDGFEEKEKDAINRLRIETINVRLKNEKGKRYASSKWM